MNLRTKIIIYLIILLLIDSLPIPLPVTALIMLYVVMQRPAWFSDVVRQIYN